MNFSSLVISVMFKQVNISKNAAEMQSLPDKLGAEKSAKFIIL